MDEEVTAASPFSTEKEYRAAERKVLFPETDTRVIAFGEHKVKIRPMPGTYQQQLVEIAEPLIDAFQESPRAGIKGVIPALIEACAILAQFYKIPGADKKWIGETMDDGEMFTAVQTQLAAGTTNSFLRRGVLALLKLAQETFDGLAEADPSGIREQAANLFRDVFGERPTSMPLSASPGASPSESSSSDTQKAS